VPDPNYTKDSHVFSVFLRSVHIKSACKNIGEIETKVMATHIGLAPISQTESAFVCSEAEPLKKGVETEV